MTTLHIDAPDPRKAPLKVNAFERARIANSMLSPLFPYLERGAMVPCLSLATGGPGKRYQMFKHYNSVDEVVTVFAAVGVARGKAGHVIVGAREHFVNLSFADPEDPASYTLSVVTQRQWQKPEPQTEKVSVVCEQCHTPLASCAFPSDVSEEQQRALAAAGRHATFQTHVQAAKLAEELAAHPERLDCAECGHHNAQFGIADWGWDEYTRQAAGADAAQTAYQAALPA